ncbi:MAG: hypothetical protein U1B78_05370 [Dehalococcoidia bacterium]|nr:hypothetical protein [Dehalococcoidia bacterium]
MDGNGDGRIDAADANPATLPDITGDAVVDGQDTSLVGDVEFTLHDGGVAGCEDGRGPDPDWQVSAPPKLDCAAGERGVLLLAVGGGAVNLAVPDNAAGARWMVEQLSDELDVPTQIASVAPGLNGTSEPQRDAERWSFAYLSQRLREQPCLAVVLLGHSHGGVHATATASRLEEAGLGEQIALTVLIDRVTGLYAGDTASLPQSSRVFNVFLPPGADVIIGAAIDQPNVENWDAAGAEAPERGEEGGPLRPANHSTIDNSPAVLEEVKERVAAVLSGA